MSVFQYSNSVQISSNFTYAESELFRVHKQRLVHHCEGGSTKPTDEDIIRKINFAKKTKTTTTPSLKVL